MEKRIINPWTWQNERSYVQAVEIKNAAATLYVSGQAAMNEQGAISQENMRTQLLQSIQNVEKVVQEAGYELKNMVKLKIYTTSNEELLRNFDLLQHWIEKHQIKQAMTVVEVNRLFDTLQVELEATLVK